MPPPPRGDHLHCGIFISFHLLLRILFLLCRLDNKSFAYAARAAEFAELKDAYFSLCVSVIKEPLRLKWMFLLNCLKLLGKEVFNSWVNQIPSRTGLLLTTAMLSFPKYIFFLGRCGGKHILTGLCKQLYFILKPRKH